MKYLLIIIFLLVIAKCSAQDSTICIPIKLGNLLERDRQKKLAYDSAWEIQEAEDAIQREKIIALDSANKNLHKAGMQSDSTITAQKAEIKQKNIIIKETKNDMPLWGWALVALGAIAGFLAGSN